jgi:hypothetical protein
MVEFRKRFAEAQAAIPAGGIDRRAFDRLLRPLLAQVGDGHTTLDEEATKTDAQVLVDLTPVEERLVVTGVYDPAQLSLIGATVQAIEGVPVATLTERMGARVGYENVYTNLDHLVEAAASTDRLAELLDRPALTGPVTFQVLLPGGDAAIFQAPLRSGARTGRLTPPSRLHLPPVDGSGMAAGFLDEAGQVGYFRLDSSMRYREAFEMWHLTGMDRGDWLDRVVEDVTGKKPSGREAQKLAQVPSVSERLMILTTEMKARRTPVLIVDLRENPGANPSSRTSWNTSSTLWTAPWRWIMATRSPAFRLSISSPTARIRSRRCERGPRPIFRWATWTSRVLTSGGTCAPFPHRRPKGSG